MLACLEAEPLLEPVSLFAVVLGVLTLLPARSLDISPVDGREMTKD